MAKNQVTCGLCGGTYGSAPSALVRHNQSRKHQQAIVLADAADANADAQIAAKAADDLVTIAAETLGAALAAGDTVEQAQAQAREAVEATGAVAITPAERAATDLYVLQREMEQELQRRTVDYTWRVKHQADKAPAYHAERVAPVERSLKIIREAVAQLIIAAAKDAK